MKSKLNHIATTLALTISFLLSFSASFSQEEMAETEIENEISKVINCMKKSSLDIYTLKDYNHNYHDLACQICYNIPMGSIVECDRCS